MKKLAIPALSLIITACGGGGSDSSTQSATKPTTPSGTVTNTNGTLTVIGDYQTATANNTPKNKISISGDGNTIYIQTNAESLDIIGDSNTIDVSNGVTIQSCTVLGDKNKTIKPSGLKIACSVAGNNNTGFN
jgi:hypothetical protein